VIFNWVIKRVYIIFIWNTIWGSSNLDNCFFLSLIKSLHQYYISKVLFNFSAFIICNLYSSPPCGSTPVLLGYLLLWHSCTWDKTSILWSCQVFGTVTGEVNYCINYIFSFIFFSFLFTFIRFSNLCFFFFFFFFFFLSFYICMRVWTRTFSGRLSRKSSSSSSKKTRPTKITSQFIMRIMRIIVLEHLETTWIQQEQVHDHV